MAGRWLPGRDPRRNWVEQAIEELTSQWVRCLNILPEFKIGDAVVMLSGRRVGEPATVVKINAELAQYGLRYPDMPELAFTIANFEDCAAALSVAQAVNAA